MDFNLDNISALGIDLKTGIEYTGGNDKYISALQRYFKSSENNKKKIKDYLETSDLDNLAITVHALKSNSKMIGALSLASKFEVLEIASKNKDVETIKNNIQPTLDEYEVLLDSLKPLGEIESLKAPGELSGEEAKEVAQKLLEALDDFDDDKASELINKLAGYPFRITQKNKLKEAADNIGDFMYDEAAELIREILPAIE